MALEIEHKFLVIGSEWKNQTTGILYRQGYLNTVKERTVRVRTIGDRGYLTVKGLNHGLSRLEFEYEIPHADAEQMINELVEQPIIEKYRYRIAQDMLTWEVDEFLGSNAGLVIAEIEVPNSHFIFAKPNWVGKEVSNDTRYFNNNLVLHPYQTWPENSHSHSNTQSTIP